MAQQDLYGVTKDGKFYKRPPSQDSSDSWLDRADYIGYGDWKDFQHLFFHPDGTLYGVLNSKFYKAYILRCMPLIIGSLAPRWSVAVDGMSSSFSSLTRRECCMGSQVISFTSGFLQLTVKTAGLHPPNVLGQVDGPTLSSSCSIHTGPYSASISVAISTGGPRPQRRMKTGPFETSHPRAITMTSIAFFSSWRMVNCM